MELKLDNDSIQLINAFENFTGVKVKDCLISNEFIYFITERGQARIAVGKNGRTVRHIERKMGKRIRVFEYSDDIRIFVKNLIPKANEINVAESNGGNIVEIKVNKSDRPLVIGRDRRNLKLFKEILQRNSNVKELNVR